MKRLSMMAAMVLSVAACASPASAQQWGNLTGTFKFGGDPPAPTKITPDKDVEFCGKHDLFVEKITVDPATKGLANVVIFLVPPAGKKVDIHPDYEATADAEVVLKNENCRFEPRMTFLRTSQTLVIANPDTVPHNSLVAANANRARNPIIPAGSSVKERFEKEERLPVPVSCAMHPWMSAKLTVKDHPYGAVSAADGTFTIANLPVGKWQFQAWVESPGYVQDVVVDGKKARWPRGRVEVEIKPGDNSLGVIELPAASFK